MTKSGHLFILCIEMSRKVHQLQAIMQLHSSQSRERTRLVPQMVPIAHPCHHVCSWYMAGATPLVFVSSNSVVDISVVC